MYERAIGNVPPVQEKRYWQRYIYLWINFALYEELVAKVVRHTDMNLNHKQNKNKNKNTMCARVWCYQRFDRNVARERILTF